MTWGVRTNCNHCSWVIEDFLFPLSKRGLRWSVSGMQQKETHAATKRLAMANVASSAPWE